VTDLELAVDVVVAESPRIDVARSRARVLGLEVNGVPEQSTGLVFMNPLAAEAIMNPEVWLVRSSSVTSSA